MGVEKSNEWSVSYFASFSIDAFMMESLVNFGKLALIKKELIYGGGNRF